jgi:hypothetical protein
LTGKVGAQGVGQVCETVARLPVAGCHDRQDRLHEAAAAELSFGTQSLAGGCWLDGGSEEFVTVRWRSS